jgi:opacity protein-like surface antigen
MKKLICALATLVGITAVGSAQADNFYANVFGGANWRQHDNKHHNGDNGSRSREQTRVGYLVGFDLGYRFCSGFRGEFEFAYRNNERRHHFRSNVDATGSRSRFNHQSYAALVNARYYWENVDCWDIKPFLGVGIGVASEKNRHFADGSINDSSRNHRHSSFAYQVLAGVAYPVNDCVDVDLTYRFFQATKLSRVYNHGLTLGLGYNF